MRCNWLGKFAIILRKLLATNFSNLKITIVNGKIAKRMTNLKEERLTKLAVSPEAYLINAEGFFLYHKTFLIIPLHCMHACMQQFDFV